MSRRALAEVVQDHCLTPLVHIHMCLVLELSQLTGLRPDGRAAWRLGLPTAPPPPSLQYLHLLPQPPVTGVQFRVPRLCWLLRAGVAAIVFAYGGDALALPRREAALAVAWACF